MFHNLQSKKKSISYLCSRPIFALFLCVVNKRDISEFGPYSAPLELTAPETMR